MIECGTVIECIDARWRCAFGVHDDDSCNDPKRQKSFVSSFILSAIMLLKLHLEALQMTFYNL
jgi:hypothetical protein